MTKLRIIIPTFNDWTSLRMLLEELDGVAESLPVAVFVTAVNDGSTESRHTEFQQLRPLQHLQGAEILHLSTNLGHQRAIAVGLCVAVEDNDFDAAIVMDGDGEDPPQAIAALLARAAGREDFCIVAQRRKRTEKLSFKLSYLAYKAMFQTVTGKKISFGNFSLISRSYLRRLVMVSDLWNNLPAAVLRSRLIIDTLPVDRGHRYAGSSKMNFTSLVVHGLSSVSVYADTIFVRLLLLTIFLVVFTLITTALVLTLRLLFPLHATPGWATTVIFGLVIILLQVFFTTLTSILILLNSRVQRLVIPATDFKPYLSERELIFGKRLESSVPDRVSANIVPREPAYVTG